MTLPRIFLALLFAVSLGAQAQPIASEPQAREWTEKDPPNGLAIVNSDKYIDYTRDGKIVFRTVERIVSVTAKPNQEVAKTTQHLIEFVADGNVFASVALDGASVLNWTMVSGAPVYFTSGSAGGPKRRFFHVCVPQHDYYEYLEISGTEVKLSPETPDSYTARKRGFIQMTERGFIHKLGHEQLLDQDKR